MAPRRPSSHTSPPSRSSSGGARALSPVPEGPDGAGRGSAQRVLEMAAAIARDTTALVLPRICACGAEGSIPCARCAAVISAQPLRIDAALGALQLLAHADARGGTADFAPLMPVLALGEHREELRALVLAFKNRGLACLADPFGIALAPALDALCAQGAGTAEGRAAVVLVPVPSSLSSRLRRGEDHTALLARAIARSHRGARVRTGLALRGPSQAGRDRHARHARADAARIQVPARLRGIQRIVLVDDVGTTGATLRAAHDALTAAGCGVIGALVIASARLPPAPSVLTAGAEIDAGASDDIHG